ncbi:MAG: hypothetical protein M3137_14110 [Actinomycetota bacterium]|nr:hypothetical protein [Actinomycetota bacterium]
MANIAATTSTRRFDEEARRDDRSQTSTTVKVVAGGSATEAVAGAGAVVLTILGLLAVAPVRLAAVAAIAIGGGLLVRGAAVAARATALRASANADGRELVGGLGVEMMAGVGGVALGVLALLSVQPTVLLPAAVIGFGVALMLGAAVTQQVQAAIGGSQSGFASAAFAADMGGEVLIGLGAVVLGILAIIGITVMTLSLVGLLAVGAGMMLESSPGLARALGLGR